MKNKLIIPLTVISLMIGYSNLAGETNASVGEAASPTLIKAVKPDYPADMKAAGKEGRVLIECVVDANGKALQPVVVETTDKALNQSTLDAVAQWKFRPALDVNGEPKSVIMRIPVRYTLSDSPTTRPHELQVAKH